MSGGPTIGEVTRPRPLLLPPPAVGAGGPSQGAVAAVLAELRAIRALLQEVVDRRSPV